MAYSTVHLVCSKNGNVYYYPMFSRSVSNTIKCVYSNTTYSLPPSGYDSGLRLGSNNRPFYYGIVFQFGCQHNQVLAGHYLKYIYVRPYYDTMPVLVTFRLKGTESGQDYTFTRSANTDYLTYSRYEPAKTGGEKFTLYINFTLGKKAYSGSVDFNIKDFPTGTTITYYTHIVT